MRAMSDLAGKQDIQEFWGALYDSLYDNPKAPVTREQLQASLDDMEDMFRLRGHMAVADMPPGELKGKRVLEVGPGAGGHSALFARHGAIVTAIDITQARADATAAKFALLGDDAKSCPSQIALSTLFIPTASCITPHRRKRPWTKFGVC